MGNEALLAQINDCMVRTGVPGVAVGILHDGNEALIGVGETNKNHPLPVLPDTPFRSARLARR